MEKNMTNKIKLNHLAVQQILTSHCKSTMSCLKGILESSSDSKEIKPVNSRRNQSWIFIGRTAVKLKLQYFGPLMRRTDTLEKTLMLGKFEGRRRRGWQRMRWFDVITDLMDISLSKLQVGDEQGSLACCSLWGHKESDTTEWLNWTAKNDPPPNARSARAEQLVTCLPF